jgi:chromosome segregation ATPase
MKSAYELAMERLNKTAPTVKLSADQKKQIAELESKCKAKIAEREIALKGEIAAAASAGEFEKVEALQQRLVSERKELQSELEEKKAQIHKGSARK